MKLEDKKSGNVITFYSYKGGTGRSMALANVAVILAQSGKRVLMIDWDLEAPGLPKYFKPYLPKGFDAHEGLIDLFIHAHEVLPEIKFDSDEESLLDKFFPTTSQYIIPVKAPKTNGNLFLLKAGCETHEGYSDQIGGFNWSDFFFKIRSFFTKWALYLSEQYDYVLIDSRTGHTDTGGICTMQMPDKLVLVFTPNHQSFEGISNLARKAVDARRRSHDLRPLMVYFLPSRIELNEDDLREKWLLNYRSEITEMYRTLYDLPEISLDNYVKQIQIRHASSYAYEEKLAVLEEKVEDKNSLSDVYRDFVGLLRGDTPVWMFGTNGHPTSPIKVFISYAHEDIAYQRRLETHLKPMVRSKVIQIGDNASLAWDHQSVDIHSADIILLLISVDALGSDYLWEKEIDPALKQHQNGKAILIPIILRYCDWAGTALGSLQALPDSAKPIEEWPNPDLAYLNVISNIRKTIDEIHARRH